MIAPANYLEANTHRNADLSTSQAQLQDDQILPWADPYIASLFAEQEEQLLQAVEALTLSLQYSTDRVELRTTSLGLFAA